MPTTKPRHTLTETNEVALALDVAAIEWPELAADRAALLRKLVTVGAESVTTTRRQRSSNRIERIRAAAGAATGSFPQDAREQLRDEWPQ